MALSKEKLNYHRTVSLIVDKATPILKEVLVQLAPLHQGKGSFQDVLDDPKIKAKLQGLKHNVLSIKDRQRIYPPGGDPADPEKFDITLIIVLIRNLCINLVPPPDGWDKLPRKNNKTLEAQIARLKHYRNQTISHRPKAEIPTADFDPAFTDIKDALLSLDGHLPTPRGVTDSELENIRTRVLFTEEEQDTLCKVVEDWENYDKDLKEEMKKIGDQAVEERKQISGKVDTVGGKVDAVSGKVVEAVGGKVEIVREKVVAEVEAVGGKVEKVGETLQGLTQQIQNIHNVVIEKEAQTCKSSPEHAAKHGDKSCGEKFEKELQLNYKDIKMKLKPWEKGGEYSLVLYQPMPVFRRIEKPTVVIKEKLEHPYKMFGGESEGKFTKRMILQGATGTGKTTLTQKICNDWANQKEAALKRFRFVIAIPLSLVLNDEESLFQVVRNVVGFEGIEEEEFNIFMKENQSDILLILDGFDEYRGKNNAVEKLYKGDSLKDINILLISRPWKVHSLKGYTVFELEGYEEDKQKLEEYVKKFFAEGEYKVGNFLKEVEEKKLTEVIRNPLFRTCICYIYVENEGKLPNNITGIYKDFLELKHKSKDYSVTDISHEDMQTKIGELAFHMLLNEKEGLLTQIGEIWFQSALQLGIVSVEPVSGIHTKYRVVFPHKSFQEFHIAEYVVGMDTGGEEFKKFMGTIQSIDQVFEQENVLQFCCGLSQGKKEILLAKIEEVLRRDNSLAKLMELLDKKKGYERYIHENENGTYCLKCMRVCTELEMKCDFEGPPIKLEKERETGLLYHDYLFVNKKSMEKLKNAEENSIKPKLCVLEDITTLNFLNLMKKLDLSNTDLVHLKSCEVLERSCESLLKKMGNADVSSCIILENLKMKSLQTFEKISKKLLHQKNLKVLLLKDMKDVSTPGSSSVMPKLDGSGSSLEELAIAHCDPWVAKMWVPVVGKIATIKSLQASWSDIGEFMRQTKEGLGQLKTLRIDNRNTAQNTEPCTDENNGIPLDILQQHSHLHEVEFIGCKILQKNMEQKADGNAEVDGRKESELQIFQFRRCTFMVTEDGDIFKTVEFHKNLKQIIFRACTIPEKAVTSLGQVLPKFRNLKDLRFLRNKGMQGKIPAFAAGIIQSEVEFDAMVKLSMEDCIEDENDMESMVKIINKCPNLQYLSLNNVDSKAKQSTCAVPLLESDLPESLVKLLLIGLKIGSNIDQFVGTLLSLENLQVLSLTENELGVEVECLLEILDELPKLTELGLCSNKLTKEVRQKFLEYGKSRPDLNIRFDLHEK